MNVAIQNMLKHGSSDLDLRQMALDQRMEKEELLLSPNAKKRVPTKFPPPPYLPGETERRIALLNEDSEVERINKQLEYDKTLFHYF